MQTLQRNQASVNSQISDFLSAEPRYPAIVNKMRLPPGVFADFARNHPLTPDVKGSRHKEACRKFMNDTAESLRGWAGSLRAEADRLAARLGETPDGETFVWLRKHCDAARAQSDALALDDLAEQIRKRLDKKQRAARQTR